MENYYQKIGDEVSIVGDDLFVTNKKILEKGINNGSANSILIKVNQIGTVSETLETISQIKTILILLYLSLVKQKIHLFQI